MCTFINSLPSQSNSAGDKKKKNLALFIRPTAEGEYYKFRLLAFKSPTKNNRDYPFIERYVHQHWGKNENGKSVIDGEVICPVTKYVNVDGNPYDNCPICRYVNMNWLSYRESGKTDKESARQAAVHGRKFEAIIPVYVRNDPTYPKNNNKFRVLIFTDKKFYESFKALIQTTSRSACCFNGKNAVDFYIHMTQRPKIVNEGLPNQYTFNENVIDKFGFTKIEKAYDIPQITKDAIDKDFPFDETYYVSSTPEELQDYYNKFIKVSNDDIPDEDVEVYSAPAKEVKPIVTNKVVKTELENSNKVESNDISDESIDDIAGSLLTDDDTDVPESGADATSDDLDSLVDGLDDLV